MFISIGAEKAFDKIQHLFLLKSFSKLVIEENFLNLIKDIYKKSTANILNNEKPNSFPLRSSTKQTCLVLPLLFNIVVEFLASM